MQTNIHPEHHQQLNTIAKIRLEETTRRHVPLSPTRRLAQNEVEQTIQEAKVRRGVVSVYSVSFPSFELLASAESSRQKRRIFRNP